MVSENYQMSISCVLIDIDLVSKIFETWFNGFSSLFGARLFQIWCNISYVHFPKFEIYKNNIVEKRFHIFLFPLQYFWYI